MWAPFDGPEATWTYAELAEASSRLAGALKSRGIRQGDRLLICLHNCPEFLLAWLACARLGSVAVFANPNAAGEELAYYADHSQARAAITQPSLAGSVSQHCRKLRWVAVTSNDGGTPAGPESRPASEDSLDALMRRANRVRTRPPDPTLPLSIQYTSGTTARPKGVVMTHANALWAAKIGAGHEALRSDDIFLIHLPLYHVIGLFYSFLPTLWMGGTVVLLPRFSASRFWPLSVRYGCSWTSMVPFCVRALSDHERPASHRYRAWGNAFWHEQLERDFGVHVLGWWGMTELITQGIVGEPGLPGRSMAIGRPAPEYRVAVVGDQGLPVEPGNTGHLLVRGVRGLSLFSEYLDEPERTAECFTEHGYFRTGDRVVVHADGYLQFADRDKDMLKVGGENVAASEIERVLLATPGVREAAVVGRPHDMLGEVPIAFVTVMQSGGESPAETAGAILAACRDALASFKVPDEVRVVDALPRGSTHKIAKTELRERAAHPDGK